MKEALEPRARTMRGTWCRKRLHDLSEPSSVYVDPNGRRRCQECFRSWTKARPALSEEGRLGKAAQKRSQRRHQIAAMTLEEYAAHRAVKREALRTWRSKVAATA